MSDYKEEYSLRMAMECGNDFHARKAARTTYYKRFIEGWKMMPCGACAGSGWYDNTDRHGNQPRCSNCEGTGKERVSPEEFKRYLEVKRSLKSKGWS